MLRPYKENHFQRRLIFSYALPSERKINTGTRSMIKRSDLKCQPFGRELTDSILTPSSHRVQEFEEKGDHLSLPIMNGSDEDDVPLINVVCLPSPHGLPPRPP